VRVHNQKPNCSSNGIKFSYAARMLARKGSCPSRQDFFHRRTTVSSVTGVYCELPGNREWESRLNRLGGSAARIEYPPATPEINRIRAYLSKEMSS
jgi:hypothetical protein